MQNEILVAPCSYEAAKFACENFHYSKKIPTGRLLKHGVWENNQFIGAIIYSNGANPNIASPYGLEYIHVCELSRVALFKHKNPVTKIISKSLKLLHKQNPNLKLVVSYADPNQDHLGIIYQAGNWIYEGQRRNSYQYIINGKLIHGKSVYDKYGTAKIDYLRSNVDCNAEMVYIKGKFKYLYPLTKSARKKYEYLHKSYPKVITNDKKY